MFWEKKPDSKFWNNWRPVVSKLLKPFGILRGTGHVQGNSTDASAYAFEDACQNSFALFFVFLASKFTLSCCLLGSGC